jgi:hypothetical protein
MRSGASAAQAYEDTTATAFAALAGVGKPVIAAIHGFCVGGGMAVALTADLRIAADDAQLAIPAARLGLGYHAAGIDALVRLVGPSTARKCCSPRAASRPTKPSRAARERGRAEGAARRACAKWPHRSRRTRHTLRSVKLVIRELGRDAAARDAVRVRDSIHACFERRLPRGRAGVPRQAQTRLPGQVVGAPAPSPRAARAAARGVLGSRHGAVRARCPTSRSTCGRTRLSGAEVGAVFAVMPAVGILVQPIWGVLADRSGLRARSLV